MVRLLEAGLISQISLQEGNHAPKPALTREISSSARSISPPPVPTIAQQSQPAPAPLTIATRAELVQTLTACLDDAPCRESARRIFRALFSVALDVARACGYAEHVTRAVFHLPAELLMVHVGLKKSAFYENLQYLRRVGLVACDAHMGDLRGESVATGTLWAVTLKPRRVLEGKAGYVRLMHDDWGRNWRDLNADAKAGRTVYNMLHPLPKSVPESQEPCEDVTGGELREKSAPVAVTYEVVSTWAIKSALPSPSDNMTVRPAPSLAENVVWELADAHRETRPAYRAEIVDRQARALAAAFGDGADSLGFWRKLIWNITRAADAGRDVSDDVGAVLVRVLRDVKHDQTAGGTPPRNLAAVVNAALADLLGRLREYEGQRVGVRPDQAQFAA
nr:Initiation of plasmid replication [synthetic construct]